MVGEYVVLAVAAATYARGLRGLWATRGGRRAVPTWRVAAFFAGVAVVAVAVSPPLHDAAHATFTAHMVQHVLLFLVAGPLLAAGAPQVVVPRAFPALSRQVAAPVRRRLPDVDVPETFPVLLVAGTVAYLASLWIWHTPALYDAALAHGPVHALEHASFLGASMLIWSSLLRPGRKARIASGVGVLCIWLVLAQGAVLSALIVFAGEPLYATYAGNVDALADQQMAGVIMWVPGGVVYGIAGVATFIAWFRAMEDRARRRDGRPHPKIVRAPDTRPLAAAGAEETR